MLVMDIHSDWLSVVGIHSERLLLDQDSVFSLLGILSPLPVEGPHITRKLLVSPHFTEGETEVPNVA